MARAVALLCFAALTVGCSKDRDNQKAKQRLWGRETVPTEVENLAKEPLEAALVGDDAKTRARVLGMSMDELFTRFGFFHYDGLAKLDLERGEQHLVVEEKSHIEHGLHGDFRVEQTGEGGKPLREIYYHAGILFVRNAGGELRVQGIVNRQHKAVRDDAWQPLAAYTGYFGERLGLRAAGSADHHGRNALKFKLGLAPGPELVGEGSKDGPKKPVSLEGELWVDAETAVPVKCRLVGVLEIPSRATPDAGAPTGEAARLSLELDMSLKSVPGAELKPEKFIPTIKRHPTDLEPLAFLEGKTKTSTVIGGPKSAEPAKSPSDAGTADAPTTEPQKPSAESEKPSAEPSKPTAEPAKPAAEPAKPTKKKKKKKGR